MTRAETRLMKMAKERGAEVIPGIEMFVHQAARQFEIWTGKPAPWDEMMRVVTLALQERDGPSCQGSQEVGQTRTSGVRLQTSDSICLKAEGRRPPSDARSPLLLIMQQREHVVTLQVIPPLEKIQLDHETQSGNFCAQ